MTSLSDDEYEGKAEAVDPDYNPYERAWSPRTAARIGKAKEDLKAMRTTSQKSIKKASGALEKASSLLANYFATIPVEELSKKIKRCFESFDTNQNGTLEPGELEDALAEMGKRPTQPELVDIMDEFDTDHNGTIELDEFEHMVRANLGVLQTKDFQCKCRLCEEHKKKAHEEVRAAMEAEKAAASHKLYTDALSQAKEEGISSPPREKVRADPSEIHHLTPDQRKGFTAEEQARIEATMSDLANAKCIAKDSLVHAHSTLEVCSGILVNYFATIPPKQLSARIRQTFENFDLNKNGTLEPAELMDALGEMGRRPTPEEFQDMMEIFDADGNGFIDYEEFEHMVRSQLNIAREYCPCAVCEKLRQEMQSIKKEERQHEARQARRNSLKSNPEAHQAHRRSSTGSQKSGGGKPPHSAEGGQREPAIVNLKL